MDDLMRSLTHSIQSFLGINDEQDIALRAVCSTLKENSCLFNIV